MTITRLGQRSLRLDAAYCLVAGLLVLATAAATGPLLAVPTGWVIAAGAATILWSALLWRLSRAPGRAALRAVLAGSPGVTIATNS